MACGKLAEELITRDPERFDITVIGEEPHGTYNRIKLVVKLKDQALPDLFLNTIEWYQTNGINLILGKAAKLITPSTKEIQLEDGTVIGYDKLVLATGSKPIIPPMPGLDLPGIFTLRRLDDVDRVLEFLRDKSRVMVVGGGLLGIELALMLRLLGKQITVSHLMPTLMEMQLPEEAGRYLQRHLENIGIRFVMGTYITELLGTTGGVSEARFKDGRSLPTDAVFFNCGIRPNADLARAAGLICNRGVAVNDKLQTSDPSIYACGECLEFQGNVWGLVAPVYEQARALAAILCGEQVTYRPSPPAPTRLKSDVPVISMGRFKPEDGDEITMFTDPGTGTYKQLIVRDGYLRGAVLVGEDLNDDLISLHYTAHMPVPERRADLLFPGARAGEGIIDGKQIPDDAQVCDCNGISAATIRRSIKAGNDTLYKVMLNTKAGTGCGTCKNKLKALLIAEVGELREDPADAWFVAGIPMERQELTDFIIKHDFRSASAVFAAIPGSSDDAKSRMGLDFLLNYIWCGDYTVERDARAVNDRYSGNIQNDGRFSVIPNMPGGLVEAKHLRAIADVAERYNATIKVTGADRIGLYALHKKDLRNVWQQLQMGCGHAFSKSFRACKACVGSTYCRFGLKDSLELGRRMGERYRGMSGPAKMKMGVSGCPRNCSEATIKDFGVIGVEGGWDIYIGGNGGARVSVAQKIAHETDDENVIRLADRFYEYYRRYARYGERSATFIERVGLRTVVDAILNAPPEALNELEKRFQQALDNYRDPWIAEEDLNNEGDQVEPMISDGFIDLAPVADIPPGSSRLYMVDDRPVALFHGRDDSWVAAYGICPHEKGPLVDSTYGDGRLTCPMHGYSFDVVNGTCDNTDIEPLRIYRTKVRNGRICVDADLLAPSL